MARVNTARVVDAWRNHRRAKFCRSIWTDGEAIYSYSTRMLWREPESMTLYLNVHKYSVTTTIHQNGIANELHDWNLARVNGENLADAKENDAVAARYFEQAAERRKAKREARKELREACKAFKLAQEAKEEATGALLVAHTRANEVLPRREYHALCETLSAEGL